MNKIRVIVNGAFGKMGRLTCETFNAQPDFELVAQLGRQDSLKQYIEQYQPDIVVDFTRADVVYENTKTIIQLKCHPVIGTSGLLSNQVDELMGLCSAAKLGGLIIPNFSIGAVLLMRFSKMAAHYFSHVEIIEAHHPAKADAPSGTAIKTAAMIAETRSKDHATLAGHELIKGARGALCHDIPIHAVRLPGVLADQQVIFGQIGETLTLAHRTIDRACFMPGLLIACRKVLDLNTLYYGLEHVLEG